MKKRFGVLIIIGNILKILGIVVGALSLLGGLIALVLSFAGGQFWSLFGLNANNALFTGIATALSLIILGSLYALFIYGYGELVFLLISLEDNTHKTVALMDKMPKEEEEVEKT